MGSLGVVGYRPGHDQFYLSTGRESPVVRVPVVFLWGVVLGRWVCWLVILQTF